MTAAKHDPKDQRPAHHDPADAYAEPTAKVPPPSGHDAEGLRQSIRALVATLNAAMAGLADVEGKVELYGQMADRSSDLRTEHDVLQRGLAALRQEVKARREEHEQEVAEWATQRQAELRAHADGIEQRRVKMEDDLAKRQEARDADFRAREKKLGEAEKQAAAKLNELQDEIRTLTRQKDLLKADVDNLEALKHTIRDDLAATRAKLS